MKKAILLLLCIGLYGCPPPKPGGPSGDWGWKLATDPDDALQFLNGTGAYDRPVSEARISAIWKDGHVEFYIYYRRSPGGGDAGHWGWKLASDPNDAWHFLNGTGSYARPVSDAQIAALWRDGARLFYIFYQRSDPNGTVPGSWGWKRSQDPSDAMRFLNGTEPYHRPVTTARIAALDRDSGSEFYIFYQRGDVSAEIGNWSWKLATDTQDTSDYVNGHGAYGDPLAGFELSATWRTTHKRFGSYWIPGCSATKSRSRESRSCFPRCLALCTNSKNPR